MGGETFLGIELGSTRIKAVLIGKDHGKPIATGSHGWENKLVNGIWTYSLDEVWSGLRSCYRDLASDVERRYGAPLTTVGALGISGMMHGYMAFDKEGALLAPFRTWRNTMTARASEALTDLFNFNIPQRWSVAHLYQSILNGEAHVADIDYLTTLAGYIHWRLTGERVMGIGEASGMFPVNSAKKDFDRNMMDKLDAEIGNRGYAWRLEDILPRVLTAGACAGALTEEGARLLDESGRLRPGIPMCPPEGDAGTGMVATNSTAPRTGNVSAGTSVFVMAVLERSLSRVYPEIDMVATPGGNPVAMVHCNNCTGDLDAWVGLLRETLETFGAGADMDTLYGALYNKALEGDADCGGLLAYNYLSGEHVTGFAQGRPLFVRRPESKMSLANFMRANLYAALGGLKTGVDILFEKESVGLDMISGHGGLFKVPGVGQRIMAAALDTPVSVMETAGEGGPWGIALLAAYMACGAEGESLEAYLGERVFSAGASVVVSPLAEDVAGFKAFMARYTDGLAIERAAVESI